MLLIDESCGALIDLLKKRAKDLSVLELSIVEMKIASLRYKDKDMHFIHSSLQDFTTTERYDYIVAIGVFSYIKNHLAKLKQFLKKEGTLLFLAEEELRSSKQMKKKLKDIGFKDSFFYYPYPDFIYAQEIYSEEFLPEHLEFDSYLIEAKV